MNKKTPITWDKVVFGTTRIVDEGGELHGTIVAEYRNLVWVAFTNPQGEHSTFTIGRQDLIDIWGLDEEPPPSPTYIVRVTFESTVANPDPESIETNLTQIEGKEYRTTDRQWAQQVYNNLMGEGE